MKHGPWGGGAVWLKWWLSIRCWGFVMGMQTVVEDSPQRLTGAQLVQAITLLSAEQNSAGHWRSR